MAEHNPPEPDFSTAAVLIAAHGSPSSSGGRSATRKHAKNLAKLAPFSQVEAGFLSEKPYASDVLDAMTADKVYVVPNTASDGFITREKLPAALGLTGRVSERIGPSGRQQVILTEAVGTHPLVAAILAENILSAVKGLDIDPSDTAVIVVGHGSTKGNANAEQTNKVAAALHQHGLDLPFATAFLEQDPKVQNWRALTTAKTVVFAPFLISEGFHATQDIPLAIGFDPSDEAFQAALANDQPVQMRLGKTRVIFLNPVGESPQVADVILARIKHARDALL